VSSTSPTSGPADQPVVAAPAPGPRDWGTIDGKTLRPGIGIRDGSCTTNFLFHDNWTRFFLGSAGHCFTTYDPAAPRALCGAIDWLQYGQGVELDGRDGSPVIGTLAYNSAQAMTEAEATGQACVDNDFALIELPAEVLSRAHPAVLYYGGPVALDNHTLIPGDDVYFFGNSGTRQGKTPMTVMGHPDVGESELLSPQHLVFSEYRNEGWDFNWQSLTTWNPLSGQGPASTDHGPIQGDSGGPFLGPTGNALAMLGGGANNLEYALTWMAENHAWSVELVTWNEFSPNGIEDLQVA
jgi:hypothetical protein